MLPHFLLVLLFSTASAVPMKGTIGSGMLPVATDIDTAIHPANEQYCRINVKDSCRDIDPGTNYDNEASHF